MPAEDKMTIDERRKYLRRMKPRYDEATKQKRGELLNEMIVMTSMHRKSLIRHLSAIDLSRKPRQKQRGRHYGPEVDEAIRIIAEAMDYVCAERLQPQLKPMALHLATFGELHLTPQLLVDLERISIASVGRILRRVKQYTHRLPRKPPQPRSRLSKDIPVGRIPWNETQPGHFEVDTVHHCGSSADGTYVHTIQMVDVATGWSERVAVFGRSQPEMEAGFKRIRSRLPMPVQQLHPDNGSEFLNDHVIRSWTEAAKGLKLSRSRAWVKNDNRFVEQKNKTLVRAYFGLLRFDGRSQCQLMNRLYDLMWLYYNLFQPVMRLKEKIVLSHEGGVPHVRHRYDEARTPFQRLCETKAITSEKRAELEGLRQSTNPRKLRKQIYQLLEQLWDSAREIADMTIEDSLPAEGIKQQIGGNSSR
jgi:hypothetical protein